MPEARQLLDGKNAEFWNELCGTKLASSLGICDSSPASLKKFDDWYFEFYPYLLREIPFSALQGQHVLEVGLGYGSTGQRLAQYGARYVGLDVAAGPLAMMKLRLKQIGADGDVVQGSILECPFGDEAFDAVVAIGCYHHTGNLERALRETWRVLRPSGSAYIMIYYAYSYRRWIQPRHRTWQYLLWDKLGFGPRPASTAEERARYDTSSDGRAAPHTDFTSVSHLRRMAPEWSRVSVRRENIGAEGPLKHLARPTALRLFGCWLGLDLYCNLRK